jgi:2,4-dienoyl-CoA reductase-like NADH-dependent reductase (Old Yellow Enzyme family)
MYTTNIITQGPGLTFVEATAVVPEGRITPEDSGLWNDSQMEPLRYSVEFAHSQNQHIGIQLGHAGRKASTVAPWLSSGDTAVEEVGGWPDNVWAPSAIAFDPKYPTPKAMTKEKIEEFKAAFVASVKRALAIGFDAIEIHGAHGYLLHEFFSPVSNKRTDEYGGSFENRIRLLIETIDLVKPILPRDFPLFVRISATDWLDDVPEFEDSWKLSDSVELAKILASKGVDLLDVSSGGIHPKQNITIRGAGYQSSFALEIKKAVGDSMLVTSVGAISDGKLAQKLLDEGLDGVMIARGFQRHPGLVWSFADELGVEINQANQIGWGFGGRGKVRAGSGKKE